MIQKKDYINIWEIIIVNKMKSGGDYMGTDADYIKGTMHVLTEYLRNAIPNLLIRGEHSNQIVMADNEITYEWMTLEEKNACVVYAKLVLKALDEYESLISEKKIEVIAFPGTDLTAVDMLLFWDGLSSAAIKFLPNKKGRTVDFAKISGILCGTRVFLVPWLDERSKERLTKTFSRVVEVLEMYAGEPWDAIPEKEHALFLPIIKAFEEEFPRSFSEHGRARTILNWLMPGFDSLYQFHLTEAGVLAIYYDFQERFGRMKLPENLLACRQKLRAGKLQSTILEMIFDHGWEMEFRIRSTGKAVSKNGLRYELSLKSLPVGVVPILYTMEDIGM